MHEHVMIVLPLTTCTRTLKKKVLALERLSETCPPRPNRVDKRIFFWNDNEVELLLTVTHQYKVQQLIEGTSWESVKSKYADILALFQSELPETGDTRQLLKDYPHTRDQVSKEIIATKLKAIRNKFRQVRITIMQCTVLDYQGRIQDFLNGVLLCH